MSFIPYRYGLDLLDRSPPVVQRLVESGMRTVPKTVLYGKNFMTKLRLICQTERWSRAELISYQEKRLREIITHAYNSVPFYHDLLRGMNLYPQDISNIADLKKLPTLTKDSIVKNQGSLVSSVAEKYLPGKTFTSGSTGKPFDFLIDQQNREMELAAVCRHVQWCGITDVNARVAGFRGNFVNERTSKMISKWDGKLGEKVFNSYNINNETIRLVANELDRYKPQLIRGYPHALYILSRTMLNNDIALKNPPEAIITSSETLLSHMRDCIEEALGARVFDYYGQSENVISAGQCEEGLYHQTMESGILATTVDDWGTERLVGTSLWNYSMPFINYEIGDCVTLGPESCPCGREHLTIKNIEGRVNDIILTTGGNPIPGVGLDNFYKRVILHRITARPEYFKLVQEDLDRYSIDIFSTAPLTESDLISIHTSFVELFGNGANINIRQLGSIPETKKWRVFESRLNLDTYLKRNCSS